MTLDGRISRFGLRGVLFLIPRYVAQKYDSISRPCLAFPGGGLSQLENPAHFKSNHPRAKTPRCEIVYLDNGTCLIAGIQDRKTCPPAMFGTGIPPPFLSHPSLLLLGSWSVRVGRDNTFEERIKVCDGIGVLKR
jgi:hypothetical protein